MTKRIEAIFREEFSYWGIELPAENVAQRRRGKIVEKGWAIWYLFGSDERGEYLDYYASHRMTEDRHIRIYSDGEQVTLPAIRGMRIGSKNPEEDARLEAEHDAKNRETAEMLKAKGFWFEGDEPGGVVINRYLRMKGAGPK
ncbi:MAG: hypothetical protein D6815_09475 [Candidatus Dadabacteria bacterium]|nr:MAG: hypothetical protein D6815_09475 [Candidatus Dadabacteria bacterium]